MVQDLNSKAGLIADFKERYKTVPEVPSSAKAVQIPEGKKLILSAVRAASRTFDELLINNAAKQIRKIALGKSYLSKDNEFSRVFNQLQEAADQFVKMVS